MVHIKQSITEFSPKYKVVQIQYQSHVDFELLECVPLSYSNTHYVKNVQIRSIYGQYFSVFRLNTEIYSANIRFQSEYRKIRTRNNSVFGPFSRSVIVHYYCYCLKRQHGSNQVVYIAIFNHYIDQKQWPRRGVFCKKGVRKNTQENSCAKVSFLMKLQRSGLQLY